VGEVSGLWTVVVEQLVFLWPGVAGPDWAVTVGNQNLPGLAIHHPGTLLRTRVEML